MRQDADKCRVRLRHWENTDRMHREGAYTWHAVQRLGVKRPLSRQDESRNSDPAGWDGDLSGAGRGSLHRLLQVVELRPREGNGGLTSSVLGESVALPWQASLLDFSLQRAVEHVVPLGSKQLLQ